MKTSKNQLSLFDYQPDLDYPLIVAEKWNFNLSYADIEAGRYYHAVQWMSGLGAKTSASWQDMKKELYASGIELEIQVLPHLASNNKTYEVDFISEKSCYVVVQNMRATKKRPQLKEIQDYLAQSGCFVNWARQNPAEAIEILKPLAAIKREKQIALHQQWGLDEKPEALRFKARHDLAEEHKQMLSELFRTCTNPDVARITNAEYYAVLGANATTLKAMLNTKSIRDSLDTPQLKALEFAESSLRLVLSSMANATNEQIEGVIYRIMPSIGESLRVVCEAVGIHHITGKPLLGDGR